MLFKEWWKKKSSIHLISNMDVAEEAWQAGQRELKREIGKVPRYYMKSNGGFLGSKDGDWVKWSDLRKLSEE